MSHLLPLVCRRHSLWTESFWVSSTRQSCKTMRTTTSKYCRSKHGSLSFQLQCSMFILHFDQRLVMSLIVHKLLVRHVCCIDSRADRASSGQQCRFPWLALAANRLSKSLLWLLMPKASCHGLISDLTSSCSHKAVWIRVGQLMMLN